MEHLKVHLLILTIFCVLPSIKPRALGTPVTIWVLVKRLTFYFLFYYLSKQNDTGGDLQYWQQSKLLYIWYVIGNAWSVFILCETKNSSKQCFCFECDSFRTISFLCASQR